MAKVVFVPHLPDLIHPADYATDPGGREVPLRVRVTADGVEVLGDAMRAGELEALPAALGPDAIEQMLCG